MKIKELLKINLDEEINTVVDLDTNPTDAAIKEGLDSFVLTNSLGKHLYDFLEEYSGGSMQSGVWLSGFYGSGKSYFAQIIGLLLQNKTIFGTPMRDRFSVKLDGLKNEDLLRSELGNLNRYNNIVVSFDASKHNNVNGLPYMIFSAFLRKLGMPDTEEGLIEYDLLLSGRRKEFLDAVQSSIGKTWSEAIKSNSDMIDAFEPALLSIGYTQKQIDRLLKKATQTRNEYDAARLQQDLSRYLNESPDTRIVFFIDEVSEAITQKKIRLDDLEGVAEALAALGRKVWTIAIAQQRLDDVIKAENIQLNSLTKVRDRFRTKIAIEADEVDTIIRHRLLAKTDNNKAVLRDYFAENNGVIADVTNLGVLEKTDNVDTYIDYYPFYKHQFKLLQYFLFGSSELTQTRVGNRGMIISAFDVLKKEVKHKTTDHYHVNATQLCNQADDRVEEALNNRYRQADVVLSGEKFDHISGKKLLQTLNFLTKSEVARRTANNIAKSYLNRPEDYHDILHEVKRALSILERSQIVIKSGEQYSITSEAEQRILDDMRRFDVQSWEIIKDVNTVIKNRDFVKTLATISVSGMNVSFKVATVDGEVFANSDESNLSIILSDLLSSTGKKDISFVDGIRQETADTKGLVTLIPSIDYRDEIKELATELRRLKYISDKTNLTDDEKKIINSLCSERDHKEARFKELIEKSYLEGIAVYCFNKAILTPNTYRAVVSDLQLKMFENVFTKRLSAELRDSDALGVFTKNPSQLYSYFGTSPDFRFFDTAGTFIGTNLSVVTEILAKTTTFTSGKELEEKLSGAPTGYSLGTIMTTLAALFRGDKIIVKYNGEEYTSCRQPGATDAFKNSKTFAKASFKAVSQSLTYNQRREIIDILKDDCEYTKLTRKNINYQLNDFEIVDAIRSLSVEMISRINHRIEDDEDYRRMFPMSKAARSVFQQYQSPVTEANFLNTAKSLLIESNTDEFIKAVERVNKDIKFIDEKMSDIRSMLTYIDEVKDQFEKALGLDEKIRAKYDHFMQCYNADIVAHYTAMRKDVQDIRDTYISTFKLIAQKTKTAYTQLLSKTEAIKSQIDQYPREWNSRINKELVRLITRCQAYAKITTTFDNYSVKSLGSRLDLRDVVNAYENVQTIDNSIYALEAQIQTTAPTPSVPPTSGSSTDSSSTSTSTSTPPATTSPKTHKLKNHLPKGDITVDDYRKWLTRQLALLNSFADNDLINLND
ncbi:MAG: BREX system P-loop protein BrxC [Muribaculaceae bacterium]|nr:BREX system P-loop protein BrxC [Muribaculaceae bacterium]